MVSICRKATKTTEPLFLVVADGKTKSNNHELWLKRLRTDIRVNLFTRGVVQERFTQELISLSMEAFKTHGGKKQSGHEQEAELDDLQKPLPIHTSMVKKCFGSSKELFQGVL